MLSTVGLEEMEVLTEVLKEYLTDLRSEILDTDDHIYKQNLRHKEEILRVLLAKFENERQTLHRFVKA
ncbi:MAG: hypothetical protein WB626_11395 [Bacteroidota bacterium]